MPLSNRTPQASGESILSRPISFLDGQNSTSSALQGDVDQLVSGFVEQATEVKTLASLTAGGLAYRFGKMGVMGMRVGAYGNTPLRVASIAFGLGSEVSAFEFTNRTLQSFSPSPVTGHLSPFLWSWSGPGGWEQSLLTDFITFGTLKGAGHLSRESNVLFQHAFASTAMVAGHQTTSLLGITPKPEGSLAQQFLHAEVTNLQFAAGLNLLYGLAPRIVALEREWDLASSVKSQDRGLKNDSFFADNFLSPPPILEPGGPHGSFPPSGPRDASRPHAMMMEGKGESGGRYYGDRSTHKIPLPFGRMEAILSRLPEISQNPIEDLKVETDKGEIHLNRTPRYNAFGQLTRKLQATALPPSLSQAFEKTLWDFEPPPEGASTETVEKTLEEISRRVFDFYLNNRDQTYALSEKAIPEWEILRKMDEEAFEPFWELQVLSEERLQFYQSAAQKIFSLVKQNKQPYWVLHYRPPGEDLGRILVTQEALQVVLNEIKQKGEFSFQSPKENPGEPALVIRKDDFCGALPLTDYNLTQVALEPLLSPSLFKAAFGLMDYILTSEPQPMLEQEMKEDLQRVALLLLLGAEERGILETFRERVLKRYYQNRESFIDRIDFLRYEENFDVVPEVTPTHHLYSPDLRNTFLRFVNDAGLPLDINYRSVLVLGMLRRIYQTKNPHLIRQLHYQAPRAEAEELPPWIARFYFEHQTEIWTLLNEKKELQ